VTDHPFHDLAPDEFLLLGEWLDGVTGVIGDAVENRIKWLTQHRLIARSTASDGWDWLFLDPQDGRLWELTFPTVSLHGSGPRQLAVITREAAAAKYGAAGDRPATP
jgi:hypothetical protein